LEDKKVKEEFLKKIEKVPKISRYKLNWHPSGKFQAIDLRSFDSYEFCFSTLASAPDSIPPSTFR